MDQDEVIELDESDIVEYIYDTDVDLSVDLANVEFVEEGAPFLLTNRTN